MAEDLVTVATYRFLPVAEDAKLYLQEQGIQAFLANVQTVHIGYVHLQVSNAEAAQAAALLEILHQRHKEREETEWNAEEDEESPLTCLSCGAPMTDQDTKCAKCGWSYAEGESA